MLSTMPMICQNKKFWNLANLSLSLRLSSRPPLESTAVLDVSGPLRQDVCWSDMSARRSPFSRLEVLEFHAS
jgi:hypothetical protein